MCVCVCVGEKSGGRVGLLGGLGRLCEGLLRSGFKVSCVI